ncbi:MAG: PorV/PorQ family protein [Candidatus Marinimicrobia bacterium]|jgi:hypothetical protein|nr:PorV/PorQ family protein [Candidatus Neomarinimicrobiota bacterium]|tara:strand:- start:321 stop:1325 length:1005 start_codon:yes stop_codon:yes gene_type:complete
MTIVRSFIYIICLSSTLFGVDKTGTMAAKFLSTNIGSRAVGMGGAFTAVANDGSSMFWNPAGIGFNHLNKFYVNHSSWIADIAFDYFSVSLPIGKNRYLGINITSVTMGDMEVTRYGNEDTGETFSASDHAFGLTYALNLTDRFSIGLNGKLIQEKIANNYANGIALDLGTLFKTPYGFRLGTSISNFGPKMKMTGDDLLVAVDIDESIDGNNESVTGYLSTDKFDLPLILRVGISNDMFIGKTMRVTWALDSNSPNDNKSYVNAGVEIGLMNDLLVLRSGVNSLFLDDRESEVSYGIGIRSPLLKRQDIYINYCFEMLKHLGNTHQISIGISY